MRFSDLPNPKVAAEAVRDFQRRYSTKVCLAPDIKQCTNKIVSAHTLSARGMLRPIARDGHVYTYHTDLFATDREKATTFRLTGIADTSVFNGFCSYHDAKIFSPIESLPFLCRTDQLFLHAFRAVAKESYLKRKQAESTPTEALIKNIHGIPGHVNLGLDELFILQKAASLTGAEEIERLKARLDSYYLTQDWRRLVTTVIPFSIVPKIVCNFVYAPDFDFVGDYLQDFEDFSKDLDHLMITVLPAAGGGYALLSHLDDCGLAPRRLISSLLARPNVTTALVWLIIGQAENIAISPDWFETLSEVERQLILQHFVCNADWYDERHNTLVECPDYIDSWENATPFTI